MDSALYPGVETTAAEPQAQRATVLVVDDERGPRLALQLILGRSFHILSADSGEEALEILKQESVDAVTLDLKMPGLGGQNTLAVIRESHPALPVIIITGYGSYESAVKALKLHAFDYISKPYDTRKILDAVNTAVEVSHRLVGLDVVAPLETALEAAHALEERAAYWMSQPDRESLDCIRASVRAARDRLMARPSDPGSSSPVEVAKERV
jgi:FixJ family two-component response regulator